MKKKLLVALSICSVTVFAQTNVGFEDGTVTGWECKSGTYGGPAAGGPCDAPPPFVYTFDATIPLSGAKDSPLNPGWGKEDMNRHTIMTTAAPKDPNSKGVISPVAPGNLFPTGTNNYSFRLGNSVCKKGNAQEQAFAEGAKITFTVNKDNAGLTYMYAAFLFDYDHPSLEAPRFEIKISQLVNGKDEQIKCGYYKISAKDAASDFHDGAGFGNQIWKYTDWTKVALDLTTYIGKQVTIEFTTADCYPKDDQKSKGQNCVWGTGSHSAYAYIDLYTAPVSIEGPAICANAPSIQLCAPSGYSTYQWPSGQPGVQPPLNQRCVTILKPKAGDKYTVNMTSSAGIGCANSMTMMLKGADFTVRDTSICKNANPFVITATPITTGTYSWKWEPATNLSCSDCPNPTFTPGTTTSYTVTMTDKNVANCDQVKNVTINVGASFSLKTTDAEICEGETATITATGADTYVWQPGNLSGATQTVTPTSTTTYTVIGTSNNASCPGDATATAVVTVNKKPIVTVTDVTVCTGEDATLTGVITGGGSAGEWIGGDGQFKPNRTVLNATYTPTKTEEAAGKVTLTLESEDPAGPCGKDSKTMTITIIPGVKANAGPDVTICFGGTAKLKAPGTDGTWSGGAGTFSDAKDPKAVYTPTAAEQAAGKIALKYSVVNNGNAACPGGSDEMIVSIEKLSVSAGADQSMCIGGVAKLTGSIGGVAAMGTWTGGNGTFDPDNNTLTASYKPTLAEATAGTVTLFLTTDASEACPAKIDSTVISINPNPVINFTVDTAKACPPHCVDFTDSSVVKGAKVVKWEWDFGNDNGSEFTKQNPKEICYPIPGSYNVSLKATSDKGCSAKLEKPYMIETYPVPVAQFTTEPNPVSLYDPTVHFYDQSSNDVKTWVWNLGDGKIISPNEKNPIHQYTVGLVRIYNVTLTVTNAYGCADSVPHPVEVRPEFTFFIPNAFTPGNSETINDTFYGKGVGIVEYQLWVFDRWGNMVFSTRDMGNGWDGRANDGAEIAQQDVFVWKVKLKDIFNKKHEYIGTVTLVR